MQPKNRTRTPNDRAYRSASSALCFLLAALALPGSAFLTGCAGDPQTAGDNHAEDDHSGDNHAGEPHSDPAAPADRFVRLTAAEAVEFAIEVRTAGPDTVRLELTVPGEIRVNEDRYAHVTPRVPGIVQAVRATLGQTVRAGEPLADLESRELADAGAAYLAALERLDLEQAHFDRVERLYQKKIAPEQEYLEARQVQAEARIALRSTRQKLHAFGLSEAYVDRLPEQPDASLTRYTLPAPIDGVVVEKHIVQGEALEADADAFEIADLSTVWVDLSIYQQDIGLVREGLPVVVTAGALTGEGTISYVRPTVSEATRTALARVVLPNADGRWKPGLFVNGAITVEAHEAAVVIPTSALQQLDDQTVVFVRTADGFAPRPITADEARGDRVAVVHGLSAGDVYVAEGAFLLKSQLQKGDRDAGHAH